MKTFSSHRYCRNCRELSRQSPLYSIAGAFARERFMRNVMRAYVCNYMRTVGTVATVRGSRWSISGEQSAGAPPTTDIGASCWPGAGILPGTVILVDASNLQVSRRRGFDAVAQCNEPTIDDRNSNMNLTTEILSAATQLGVAILNSMVAIEVGICIRKQRFAPRSHLPKQFAQCHLQSDFMKKSHSRSRSFCGESITLYDNHFQLERTRAVEESERDTLSYLADQVA